MTKMEHFAIYAADAPALKDFYVTALGLRVIVESGGDPPGYFLADAAGMALEIIGRPKGEPGANQRWVCHIAFSVDDLAATRAALEGRGLIFETDTVVDNASMRTAFFNDPEGNRCQIVWRKAPLVKLKQANADLPGSDVGDPRSLLSSRPALSRDIAPPLDPVLVLPREFFDGRSRLRDLDPGGLAVGPAPRAFPGDFLAEPFSFEIVDDQALHRFRPLDPTVNARWSPA